MRQAIGAILLGAAAVLFYFGVNASESVAAELDEAIQGAPTDQGMWLLIGSCVVAVAGVICLASRPRRA